MKTWLGECRVVDDRGVLAMCIDVEATMCLVMRVERDGSLVMDVSDGEREGRGSVHVALCFAQASHCSCFEPGLYKIWEVRVSSMEGWLEQQLPYRLRGISWQKIRPMASGAGQVSSICANE